MKNNEKKSTRRSREKFPALDPNYNLKSRIDLIDYDYIDKLSDKEKAWLNQFTEEYVNANLDRKNLDNNINKGLEAKQKIDHDNYKRRDDIYTRKKSSGMMQSTEDLQVEDESIDNYEDYLVNKLDKKED